MGRAIAQVDEATHERRESLMDFKEARRIPELDVWGICFVAGHRLGKGVFETMV